MSVISALTPQDFKNQFTKGFNYLPVWNSSNTYNIGNEVYYTTTNLFYTCLNNGVTSVPTTTSDWSITTDNVNNYVQDSDITFSYSKSQLTFNPALPYGSDANTIFIYLYLAAHYLAFSVNETGVQGIGQGNISSQSVGDVSQNFTIPDSFLTNPFYSQLQKTIYGQEYFGMIYFYLIGNTGSVFVGTNPY